VYGFNVTAVQVNLHPDGKSHHKQHRDIYGAGQKGGINCTCSFMKCSGTVCYAIGSTRGVLINTLTDSRSRYEACGEECQGRKQMHAMKSGSAMYFNTGFNNSHMHGVPPCEDPASVGPRISIALLLGAKSTVAKFMGLESDLKTTPEDEDEEEQGIAESD